MNLSIKYSRQFVEGRTLHVLMDPNFFKYVLSPHSDWHTPNPKGMATAQQDPELLKLQSSLILKAVQLLTSDTTIVCATHQQVYLVILSQPGSIAHCSVPSTHSLLVYEIMMSEVGTILSAVSVIQGPATQQLLHYPHLQRPMLDLTTSTLIFLQTVTPISLLTLILGHAGLKPSLLLTSQQRQLKLL